MAPISQPMHDITYNYKTSRDKPWEPTYSQVSNTHYYQWDNCAMMTVLPFSQNINAQYTTKTTNQSSQASEITPQDYTNNICLHTTITTSTRQMPHYQQPTYRNTSNIFTNVLSPQLPGHDSKLLKRATSKHGLESPSRPSNDTYQNQKPQCLDIWTNKEKIYNQQNKARMTKTQCTHHPHSKRDSAHMLYMPLPSATMNQLANYTPT